MKNPMRIIPLSWLVSWLLLSGTAAFAEKNQDSFESLFDSMRQQMFEQMSQFEDYFSDEQFGLGLGALGAGRNAFTTKVEVQKDKVIQTITATEQEGAMKVGTINGNGVQIKSEIKKIEEVQNEGLHSKKVINRFFFANHSASRWGLTRNCEKKCEEK